MTPRLSWVGCAIVALALRHNTAQADDSKLFELLDASIVTTASQTAETASTAPATSTTIGSDDLLRYGIHTLEEAIDFLALGVSTTGGPSLTSTTDLASRGVALANDRGSHFLILVDGHAANEPFLGTLPPDYGIGVPLEMVDHIEVIVGPGSVLYGSNAMLGVINVVTKETLALGGLHLLADAEIPVGQRVALLGGYSVPIGSKRLKITFAGQYIHQYGPDFRLGPQRLGIDPVSGRPRRSSRDGLEDGVWGGLAKESSYARVPMGMFRLRVGDLEVALRGGMSKAGRPFTAHDFDDSGAAFTTRSVALDVSYSELLTPKLRVRARAYGDAMDISDHSNLSAAYKCPYQGVRTCSYETRVVSRWAGLELQASYDWWGDARLSTLLGVDGRVRSVGSKQDMQNLDTGDYVLDSFGLINERDLTLGAYAQQIWLPVPELVINAGARLDHDQRFSSVVSPRAAATLGAWQGATLRSIYSAAFRAPNFFQSEYGDPITARAGPLEPEKVRSIEGSFEQRFGPHRLFFGVFKSWWRDLIEVRFLSFEQARLAAEQGLLPLAIPGVAHAQHQNVASIRSYGFNAGAEGLVAQRLRYGLNFTEAYSRRDDTDGSGTLLPTAPRFTANARVAYAFPHPFPSLGLVPLGRSSARFFFPFGAIRFNHGA